MASACGATFCMAKTPARDKTTPGKTSSEEKKGDGNDAGNFLEGNGGVEKSEDEYPPTPQEMTDTEPNSPNNIQEKGDDKESLPSYIETPATEGNNHTSPLENDSEEEKQEEVDEMKSVRSHHTETSPRTIHSVEASDEEERRGNI